MIIWGLAYQLPDIVNLMSLCADFDIWENREQRFLTGRDSDSLYAGQVLMIWWVCFPIGQEVAVNEQGSFLCDALTYLQRTYIIDILMTDSYNIYRNKPQTSGMIAATKNIHCIRSIERRCRVRPIIQTFCFKHSSNQQPAYPMQEQQPITSSQYSCQITDHSISSDCSCCVPSTVVPAWVWTTELFIYYCSSDPAWRRLIRYTSKSNLSIMIFTYSVESVLLVVQLEILQCNSGSPWFTLSSGEKE